MVEAQKKIADTATAGLYSKLITDQEAAVAAAAEKV